MPVFTVSEAVAAGATSNLLRNWQFRFPPVKSLLEVMVRATAVGVVMNLTTGPESIVQAESVVQSGGTAGVTPARLNTEPIVDKVDPGEECVLSVRNTSGAPITIDMIAIMTYAEALPGTKAA